MLKILRSLFSSGAPDQSSGTPVLISASSMDGTHTLRQVNGRPSHSQLKQLMTTTNRSDFVFHEASGHQYRFDLVDVGGHYRIDILESPSYGSRAEDGHSTHRYRHENGLHYICVKRGHEPRDKAVAAGIAIDWAKRTSGYIRDGRPWNS